MAIGVVLSFASILWSGIIGIVYSIFLASFSFYFLVCSYSLYSLFLKESRTKNASQYPMPLPITIPNETQPAPYGFMQPSENTVLGTFASPVAPKKMTDPEPTAPVPETTVSVEVAPEKMADPEPTAPGPDGQNETKIPID